MSKQSKWRYIGATEQRLTKIDWKLGFLGLGCAGLLLLIGAQQVQLHNAKVRLTLLEGGNTVQARTITLAPQETIQLTLGQGGYGGGMRTTPATDSYPIYTHFAVMDPSCQVHRQQKQGRVVWRGEPRVVTHNGVVSAVVTNESIVELPPVETQR